MTSPFSSWRNLRSTPYQSITALFVIITTFFLVYTFTCFLYMGDLVLAYFEKQPQVLVFFETSVSDADATAAAKLIEQLEYVDKVTIVGKTDAYEKYKQQNADRPLLMSLLSPENFPASVSISAKNAVDLDRIREEVDKLEGVDNINYRADVVHEFLHWTNVIRLCYVAICTFLAVQFYLVIMIITSMKIANHRRKINIMSLLGASRREIRTIFVREALWLGIIGSLIAFGGAQLLIYVLAPGIQEFLGTIINLPLSSEFLWGQVIYGSLAAGLMSAFAAWMATTRMVKK